MMPVRRSLFVTVFFMLASPHDAYTQIEGFVESFSGMGEFESIGGEFVGLDNPGWAIGGTEGTELAITDAGFQFDLDTESVGDRIVRYEINRGMFGQSSYVEELHIKELFLGEVTEENMLSSSGGITLSHFFVANDPSRVLVQLSEPPEPDDVWRFRLIQIGGQIVESFVSRSTDFVLNLMYDRESSTFSATYLPDEMPPTELVVPLSIDLSEVSELAFSSSGSGQNRLTGIIHSWTLTPISNVEGDFNGNGRLDVADLDDLSIEIRNGSNNLSFDLNDDTTVDHLDTQSWVHDLKNTFFGDADLNREFNTRDLVQVFAAGTYEDDIIRNSTWGSGDWNADGEFNTTDLVVAFQDGGFELGPKSHAVPEPGGALVLFGFISLFELFEEDRTRSNKAQAEKNNHGRINISAEQQLFDESSAPGRLFSLTLQASA